MEKELSVYKVTYKALNDGLLTRNSLEVTIYGEDFEQIKERLWDTKMEFHKGDLEFKIIKIERK